MPLHHTLSACAMSAMILCAAACGSKTDIETTVTLEDGSEWVLEWNDEFDYGSRDELLETWESANRSETHIVCSRWKENVEVGDGMVRLCNRKESRGGQEWTSASIWTRRFFQYGYFECRYCYAGAKATNNSFWIWSPLDKDPANGKRFKIDINEGHYPHEIATNVHEWNEKKFISSDHSSHQVEGADLSQEFHTYGVSWDKDWIVFYLDRKELRRTRNEFSLSPARVYLSEAIVTWAGEITDAIDGTQMVVDYVRVYKAK